MSKKDIPTNKHRKTTEKEDILINSPIDRTRLSSVNSDFSNEEISKATKTEKADQNKKRIFMIFVAIIILAPLAYLAYDTINNEETDNKTTQTTNSTTQTDPTKNTSEEIVEIDCSAYREVKVPENYPTIQEAIDNSGMQINIIVSTGTYNENLTILGATCLTAEGSVEIIGAQNNRPTISILGGNTKITGITVKSNATEEEVEMWHKASCVFVDGEDAMVSIVSNRFDSCHIAISAINQARLFIKGNIVEANSQKYGIALTNSEVKSEQNTVNNARYAQYYYGCEGEVSNETITGGFYGISTYSTSALQIHNNTLREVQYAGINYAEAGNDDIRDNTFENMSIELFGNDQ